jgi:hypothetical protein
MKTNKLQIIAWLAFIGFVAWWVSFQSVVKHQGLSVQWFEGTYGLMALFGAVIGLSAAKKWGGLKTVIGKSLILFSGGLLAQEAGQLIYQYYIYKSKITIPYPSWGDVAYFGSVLLYVCAAGLLAQAMGSKFLLKKNIKYKVVATLVPAALLALSYMVLLHHHQYDTSKPLTVFLDLGYPLGQAVYISIAITAFLLARKMLGGIMRNGILLIILALLLQYVADFNFIYQNSRGTYLAGRYADLLYLIAYFAMAVTMIQFHRIYSRIKNTAANSNKKELA